MNNLHSKILDLSKNNVFMSILIFTAASIFRIFFLDLIEFKYDEAWGIYMAENFHSQPFILQFSGDSSAGIKNFPLAQYIVFLISFPIRDPFYISFVIAFINSIFVVVFYFFVKKFYGNLVALFSSFILAFSPYNILFSRKNWSPDFIFFFLIPFYYFIHKLIIEKKGQAIMPAFIFLALVIQIHLSGIYLLISTIIILLILKIKVDYRKALIGLMIGFIPAIPYFWYEITSNPFCPDCLAFFNKNSIVPKLYDFNNFILPYQTINGYLTKFQLGNDLSLFFKEFPIIKYINLIYIVELIIPFFGIIYIFKYKRNYVYIILYPVIISIINFLLKSNTKSYDYHYLIINPLIAILYALSFYFLFFLIKNNIYKLIIFLIFLTVIISNIVFEVSFYKFLGTKKDIDKPYGPIFSLTKNFVEEQIKDYRLLHYYQDLKNYAYLYSYKPAIHTMLGNYFVEKNEIDFAINEYKDTINYNLNILKTNENVTYARANLINLYILAGKINEAKIELNILYKEDPQTAEKFKQLIINK